MSNISDVDRYLASLECDTGLENELDLDLRALQALLNKRDELDYHVLCVRRRIDKLLAEKQSRKDKRSK